MISRTASKEHINAMNRDGENAEGGELGRISDIEQITGCGGRDAYF